MKEIILVKLGEMVLKGLNRKTFEAILVKNIKRRLSGLGGFEIRVAQSTVYIMPLEDGTDLEPAVERVRKIFGIATFSRACVADKNMESILNAAGGYLAETLNAVQTFKVESKRSDKSFPLNSPQISAAMGEYLLQKFPHLSVNVHEPDVVVTVEIRDFGAYVRGGVIQGAGAQSR